MAHVSRKGARASRSLEASSGQDAVNKAQQHSPGVVFVDVSTPELTPALFSKLYNNSRVTVLTGTNKSKVRKLVEDAWVADSQL